LSFHQLYQMQSHSFDEVEMVAHQAVELRAIGQGREGVVQTARCVAVEVPLAIEATPSGEEG
jgi:hypothetical protein